RGGEALRGGGGWGGSGRKPCGRVGSGAAQRAASAGLRGDACHLQGSGGYGRGARWTLALSIQLQRESERQPDQLSTVSAGATRPREFPESMGSSPRVSAFPVKLRVGTVGPEYRRRLQPFAEHACV